MGSATYPRAQPPPGPDTPVMTWTVGEVMRMDVVAVAAGETVLVAWELLERIGATYLPVLLPDGRCSGLLDRLDVAVACSAPAVVLSAVDVGTLVTGRRRVAVREGESVRKAAVAMTDNGCNALPVLDSAGRLVGLLTAADIVAALVCHPAPGPQAAEGRPVGPSTLTPGLGPRRDDRVNPVP
ncbi:CBS domain-containing protein [Streptomyces kutzneri]|uniref:CBS domain-containing protein n=1 Tax=Streptomyces kutzneri TaxID=3051179 RepID=UPI0028D5FD99|nr:CBS domain-containing protein [Streptomyces sp. DSM 40907]